MFELKAPGNCFDKVRILPDLIRSVVRCDYESLIVQGDRRTLNFASGWPFVRPNLQVMTQTFALLVEVVQKYMFLADISIPPFILTFHKQVRIFCMNAVGFACSWLTIYPDPSDVWKSLCGLEHQETIYVPLIVVEHHQR